MEIFYKGEEGRDSIAMQYHVIVYGCQMNISDAERVSAVLESIKYKRTPDINRADLIVVVMCSIRQSAVNRVQGLMQKFEEMKKKKPTLKTILTGCVLKKDRKLFIEGFNYVIDIKGIGQLPILLSEMMNFSISREKFITERYLDITPKHSSKFSASVPIMTGCNNFCAYCVVPYARGREISRPAQDIVQEIKGLTKPISSRLRGAREIWLLGQNVNSYKDPSTSSGQVINFPALLKLINNIPGNFWIRFTSSHPKDFTNEVIDTIAIGEKITPYLNLPIQSGDDKILKLMNRHYTVADYKNKIKKLREKIPGICLSTDIIVGFPGETKKQFNNTIKLFQEMKYDMAYISKYSPRPGTAATKLKDNVSIIEKKRREKVLNDILKQTALENNKKYIGKINTVLIDGKDKGDWIGKNKHYKTVRIKCNKNLLGKFIKVKITKALPWSLVGKIIN